jgi:hypothetical protein
VAEKRVREEIDPVLRYCFPTTACERVASDETARQSIDGHSVKAARTIDPMCETLCHGEVYCSKSIPRPISGILLDVNDESMVALVVQCCPHVLLSINWDRKCEITYQTIFACRPSS